MPSTWPAANDSFTTKAPRGTVFSADINKIQDAIVAIETNALPTSGGSISGSLDVAGQALGEARPRNHGLIAWAYDPAHAVNSTVLTGGVQYLVGLYVPRSVSATKIYWHVAVVGVTPTAGQNEAALYDSSGSRLAVTNVDADITSTGLKTTTISSTALTAGRYWVSLIFNAATVPALSRTTGLAGSGALINVGLTASSFRFATNGTGKTSSPASITTASNAQGIPLWAAIG